MRRQTTVAILLTGAPLAALPAATTAQASSTTARLATPLSAPCYSAPFGSPKPDRPTIAGVSLTGGKPGRRFALKAATPGLSGSLKSGTFDASGNATIPMFSLGSFVPVGPGRKYQLSLFVSGSDTDLEDESSQADLGSITAAALGAALTQLNGNPNGVYRPGQKNRVVVSGAQFARKTLYGFYVKGNTKVLGRFKLGTADACGYIETKVVTRPLRFKSVSSLKIYVNAGPKFDKARSVRTSGA